MGMISFLWHSIKYICSAVALTLLEVNSSDKKHKINHSLNLKGSSLLND